MTFSFFLSIYSRCGAPASWAARHTTVCLDKSLLLIKLLPAPNATQTCIHDTLNNFLTTLIKYFDLSLHVNLENLTCMRWLLLKIVH